MNCLALLNPDPASLWSQLVSGVAIGGVYALVALGLVLIYKTSRVLNFLKATCSCGERTARSLW